ncbi:MAG: hypothetical protein AAF125_07730 [Chloroflexota bacterium]
MTSELLNGPDAIGFLLLIALTLGLLVTCIVLFVLWQRAVRQGPAAALRGETVEYKRRYKQLERERGRWGRLTVYLRQEVGAARTDAIKLLLLAAREDPAKDARLIELYERALEIEAKVMETGLPAVILDADDDLPLDSIVDGAFIPDDANPPTP